MLKVEKDKKLLGIIQESIPPLNVFRNDLNKRDEFFKLYMALVSWRQNSPDVNIHCLKDKKDFFIKKFKSKPLASKILGSERNKNHIWIVKVSNRRYVFFISLKGLTLEAENVYSPDEILSDLKEIKQFLGFKDFY